MADFESLLLKEQRNPNAAILQFFLSRYEAEQVVVVIEGPDDQAFYFDFIADYFPGKSIFYFPCSGKPSLLALKSFLESYSLGVKPEKLLFLADKDFDDYLQLVHQGVFKTDDYSIENYFCSKIYFEYVLRKLSAGQLSNAKIHDLVEAFDAQLNASVNKLIVPMAVLCAIRQLDKDADFDAISCAELFDLTTPGFCPNRGARVHSMTALTSHKIGFRSVLAFARAFRRDPFNRWLRGKHGLQLIRAIIKALGTNDPQCKQALQSLSAVFGVEALKHAKVFLGDLQSLRAYCLC
jgi:hypothetical protein